MVHDSIRSTTCSAAPVELPAMRRNSALSARTRAAVAVAASLSSGVPPCCSARRTTSSSRCSAQPRFAYGDGSLRGERA